MNVLSAGLVVGLAVGLAAAGCSDDREAPAADAGPGVHPADGHLDAAASEAGRGASSHDAGREPSACPEEPVSVEISYMRFVPRHVSVGIGCPVVWTHLDRTNVHDVTSGSPERPTGELDSGELHHGDTFTHTFDAAGRFEYFCSLHPDMMREASVTVE